MKTTVEITFALMSTDVPSAFELVNGDSNFLDTVGKMITSLKKPAATAEIPIGWPDPLPFTDPSDPKYVAALGNYSAFLHQWVADLVLPVLTTISPCPDPSLVTILPQLFRGLSARDVSPQFRIAFAASSKCDPCGKDCHKVDGKIEKSCPGGSAFTPLIWVSSSRGKVVAYQLGVNYRYIYVRSA